ncbi:adenylate cyclase type 2-like isoform X2 [Brachionus plicatilis]|uniref:Adenylate cyclase type 9 n=1 Tax=Brachionus plicatilis TaxID=10195 RepID=A0A3M7PRL7_BRAPC|nr:adenylate cyclase type 2-like isoform X2 [Brachionus plicatilis]
MNASASEATTDDNIELVELKRKNYRLSKKIKNVDSQQEEVLLGQGNNQKNFDKLDSNVNNLKANCDHRKMSGSKKSLWHKIDNILDLNLKFESVQLENAFKWSYLGVSRSIYIKYLLYLITFTLTWLFYLSLGGQRQLDIGSRYATFNKYATQSNWTIWLQVNAQTSGLMEGNTFLLSCMAIVCLIYVVIFVFLVVIEYQENEFRRDEKKLAGQEQETKVNFKLAEKDLKEAMQEVLEKEREFTQLRTKHEQDSVLVNKLRHVYQKCAYGTALLVTLLMLALCFLLFFGKQSPVSPTSHFVWFTQTILLLYLIYPFQLLIPITAGTCLSCAFEYLSLGKQFANEPSAYLHSQKTIFILVKILLHSSLHLVSAYLKVSVDSIKRDTFMKLAHMNKAHMASQQDKQISERMIKSIMPPLFTHVFGKPEEFRKNVNRVDQMRPLFIYPVSEISILFADIVGFTRMSSNKTAQELVFLLNDLYARFDRLCEQAGCEKISTLGDCYYCVSGCLNGRQDHAKCCVQMGLLMVKEIEIFNKDHDVDVNMRVGVHTGSALCGFIGGKRFRFDVWSSDVTLANKMESSGRAGWVHISEDTYKKLDAKFNTEPGENQSGKATYFVVRESKRETVADALKLTETRNSRKTLDQSQEQSAAQPLVSAERSLSCIDEQNLLTLAVKQIQFFQPETNFVTMRFESSEEAQFQAYLMGLAADNPTWHNTFCTSSRNLLPLSISVAFAINLCVSSAFFLSFVVATMTHYKHTISYTSHFLAVLIVFCVLFVFQTGLLLAFFFYNHRIWHSAKSHLANTPEYARATLRKKVLLKYALLYAFSFIFLTAVPIYLLGTGLPFMSNLNNYLWRSLLNNNTNRQANSLSEPTSRLNLFALYLYFVYTIALVNFGSFVQLSSLYKSCLSLAFALIFALCAMLGIGTNINEQIEAINRQSNQTGELALDPVAATSSLSLYSSMFLKGFVARNAVALLDFGLLVLLIWLINRQSELIQRISFKYDQEALMKITFAKEQKDLASWLIDIVIPSHVISHVKEKKQYSMNYECVGVLFVSLCNFSEFFEESYEGGRELLRVLNEISIDFDRLLDEPKYKEIEKIKSIGSTFMIASGLKLHNQNSDISHLYDLVDFALEMKEKLESFNLEAMSVCHFKFQMKMGFNCGPLTAGVIGTDRLLYDIWGDTVNVASRMDSTGQAGLLQAPEKAANLLGDDYKFYQRGLIQIKGKDKMMTYFLDPNENRKHNQN